jgi:hypothetical protein
MEELKAKFGDDRMALQQGTMAALQGREDQPDRRLLADRCCRSRSSSRSTR